MKEAGQPLEPENRYTRRQRERQDKHASPKGIVGLQVAVGFYNEAVGEWAQVAGQRLNSWSEMVYRGEKPSFLPEYFNRVRDLSHALHKTDRLKFDEPRISNITHLNVFHRKIRGLSLVDIEAMPLPLSREDLVRVSHFLRYTPLFRLLSSSQDRQAQDVAVCLPSLDLARPSEGVIPARLQPLHARMTSFFDYFLKFLDSPYLSWEQEDQFHQAVCSIGLHLLRGLGMFIPARLGITPSSALKLFDEKMVSGLRGWSWAVIKRQMKRELENAYREKGLSPALAPFQHPNTLADQTASQILQAYYQSHEIDEVDGAALFTRLQRYLKVLRAQMRSCPEGFMRLPLDHQVIEEVHLASQYKNSLTMVLRFKESGAYLTVETNGRNRLYGLPGSLVRENPHVGTLLAQEILTAILGYSRSRYPNVEPWPVVKITSPVMPLKSEPVLDDSRPPKVPVVEIPELRPPKRKRLLSVQPPFVQLQLPLPPQEKEPRFRVDYTFSRVEKMTDRMPIKMMERVMESIRRFEWGEKTAKDLTDIPGHYRLRVGDWRVILRRTEGNKYELLSIVHRSRAY